MLVGSVQGVDEWGASDGRCREDGDRGGRQGVLRDEHADVTRESVRAVVPESLEAGVSDLVAMRGEAA